MNLSMIFKEAETHVFADTSSELILTCVSKASSIFFLSCENEGMAR